MKYISLFHSYNIVQDTIFIKNNKVFNKNNQLLFKILNVPKESNLYNINIQKILMKKCFSKKKCNYFYTKHNIKIFVTINYIELRRHIKYELPIPSSKIINKLIHDNLNKIDTNSYIKNVLCINKNDKKHIDLNNNTIMPFNFNFVKFNDIYFNLKTNKFSLINNNNNLIIIAVL